MEGTHFLNLHDHHRLSLERTLSAKWVSFHPRRRHLPRKMEPNPERDNEYNEVMGVPDDEQPADEVEAEQQCVTWGA